MAIAPACETPDCTSEARVTIKTRRSNDREVMTTQVWWDERTGPKSAGRHCKEHGIELLGSLARVLIDEG